MPTSPPYQSCRRSGLGDGMQRVQESQQGAAMTDVRRVMRPNRRRFLFGSAGGIASYVLGLSPSMAQPLHSAARIMVGFPAGGPSDVLARLLAEQMKAYASSTIVENRPGAGGRVVMDVLKNSAADGSVMVLTR